MVSLEHAGGEGWIRLQRRGQPMHGAVQILSRGMFSSVATGVESARACCEHSALHTFKAPFWLLGGNGLGVEKLVRWLLKPSRRAVMVACNQSVGGRGEQLNPRLIFFFWMEELCWEVQQDQEAGESFRQRDTEGKKRMREPYIEHILCAWPVRLVT
jgi:hypothetical protein